MLYFCNAGHNPPVILDRQLSPQSQAALQYMDLEPNAPIGLWPELEFTGQSLSGIKGRPLFLYTDGLSEAENSSQQQFGDDRILEVLASQPFRDARSAVELMKSAIAVHVGDAEQSDDLTMLCINCSA
jgi:serine phosphatase RsbU (regulator of sigma subunit)